jgi:hypothetical protein
MVNLSSSFDHRIVDSWGAATFVQHVKSAGHGFVRQLQRSVLGLRGYVGVDLVGV